MRQLLVILLLVILVMPSGAGVTQAGAAGDWISQSATDTSGAGHFPMTAAIFVKNTGLPAAQTDILTYGGQNDGGWSIELGGSCSSNHWDLIKWKVVAVCSTMVPATAKWQLLAVVITSTNVHFVQIPMDTFTVATSDTGDTAAFLVPGAQKMTIAAWGPTLPNGRCTTNGGIDCTFAGAVVWDTLALTDAQLLRYAHTCDPYRTGAGNPDKFFPLNGLASRVFPDQTTVHSAATEGGGGNNLTTGANPPCSPSWKSGNSRWAY